MVGQKEQFPTSQNFCYEGAFAFLSSIIFEKKDNNFECSHSYLHVDDCLVMLIQMILILYQILSYILN